MELDTLQPGQQNFSAYADYFLDAVVAAFGVPKGVLLGDSGGSSGNRAEGIVLTRHFYSLASQAGPVRMVSRSARHLTPLLRNQIGY